MMPNVLNSFKTVNASYGEFKIEVTRFSGMARFVMVYPNNVVPSRFVNMKDDYVNYWWPDFKLVERTARLWSDSGFDMELGEFLYKTLGEPRASKR